MGALSDDIQHIDFPFKYSFKDFFQFGLSCECHKQVAWNVRFNRVQDQELYFSLVFPVVNGDKLVDWEG